MQPWMTAFAKNKILNLDFLFLEMLSFEPRKKSYASLSSKNFATFTKHYHFLF